MEKIILLPIIDGKELGGIDMGKGRPDFTYKDEMVFYKSGYIIIGSKAEYSYSIRVNRHLREDDKIMEASNGTNNNRSKDTP